MASAASFTCITCRVAFADADLQRTHYKTDWHRYNLKRKVANLPTITADNFEQRAVQLNKVDAEDSSPKSFRCNPCGKKMASEGTYNTHMQSAKHQQRVLQRAEKRRNPSAAVPASKHSQSAPSMDQEDDDDDEDVEMVSDEEWENTAIPVEQCLFCSIFSDSLEKSVKHMQEEHSLFIPDLEYLEDLEGLISYLGEKIGKGKMCLWCKDGGKMFEKTEYVQSHMRDKGHCMIRYDGDDVYEYADFYDYTSSYPEDHSGPGEVTDHTLKLDDTGYQMILPSGAKIGHRALFQYYKQNLRANPLPDRSTIKRLMGHYKAIGWTGTTGKEVTTRIKDLSYLQRQKQKHQMQVGIKANKTAQKHFRPQVIF